MDRIKNDVKHRSASKNFGRSPVWLRRSFDFAQDKLSLANGLCQGARFRIPNDGYPILSRTLRKGGIPHAPYLHFVTPNRFGDEESAFHD
jgi:hypothetical protein